MVNNMGVNKLKRNIGLFYRYHKALDIDSAYCALKDIMFYEDNAIDPKLVEAAGFDASDPVRFSPVPVVVGALLEGMHLFRARKVDSISSALEVEDFWEPPPRVIKRGRVNKPGEQMLYVADSVNTSFQEVRLIDGELSIVSIYEVIKQFEVVEIGSKNSAARTKAEKIRAKFFNDIFSAPEEYIYEISRLIANGLFSMGRNGWRYPSVRNAGGFNYCLTIPTKPNMKLVAAFAFSAGSSKPEVVCGFDFSSANGLVTTPKEVAAAEWAKFCVDHCSSSRQYRVKRVHQERETHIVW